MIGGKDWKISYMDSLVWCRFVLFGLVVLSFPLGCVAVHVYKMDRVLVADVISVGVYMKAPADQ